MRIAVVHNRVSEGEGPDAADVLAQAEAVSEALRAEGHFVEVMDCSLDLESTLAAIERYRAELVFNLVESLNGSDSLIHIFPSVLEAAGIPFTGSGSDALRITTNKVAAKERMAAAGILTPRWATQADCDASREETPAPAAWIIKSVWEHGSLGIGPDSVVRPGSAKQLHELILARRMSLGGSPVFAEEFIEGREFNILL